MASANQPGLAPPPGITPDFTGPYTLQPYLALITVVCIILTTVLVAARLYTVSMFLSPSNPAMCHSLSRKNLQVQVNSCNSLGTRILILIFKSLTRAPKENLCSEGSEMGRLLRSPHRSSGLTILPLLTSIRYVYYGMGENTFRELLTVGLLEYEQLTRDTRRASWFTYSLPSPLVSTAVVLINGTYHTGMSNMFGESVLKISYA